jgi:acetyl-CoA C-acetyltransferase
MTHSIATMTDVLRNDPGSIGLVTGVGMHMTKHVFGVYSTTPGSSGPPDSKGVQAKLDARPVKPIQDIYDGPATIATYSVVHGRDLGPEWALAVCDIPGGDRCYARAEGADLLAAMEAEEWVGRQVALSTSEGVNRITG